MIRIILSIVGISVAVVFALLPPKLGRSPVVSARFEHAKLNSSHLLSPEQQVASEAVFDQAQKDYRAIYDQIRIYDLIVGGSLIFFSLLALSPRKQ